MRYRHIKNYDKDPEDSGQSKKRPLRKCTNLFTNTHVTNSFLKCPLCNFFGYYMCFQTRPWSVSKYGHYRRRRTPTVLKVIHEGLSFGTDDIDESSIPF